MITELFLNTCFLLILNKKANIADKTIFRDILSVLNFYENKQNIEIPIIIQSKFECLRKICNMALEEDKPIANIIDSVLHSEKFKSLKDFLKTKSEEEISIEEFIENLKELRMRKKFSTVYNHHDRLTNFLNILESGTYESIEDIVGEQQGLIKSLYSSMMDENRTEDIESSSSLDLVSDSYESVLKLALKKYEKSNAISTGYPVLDNDVFNGGLEPSRIYVIGGTSGAGKSTLMNNLLINSITTPTHFHNYNNDGKKNVHVYITLENTIEEALLRTYQPLFNKTLSQSLSDFVSGVDVKQQIKNAFEKTNSTIVMKYFPAQTITVLDICSVLDDVISQYGTGSLKSLYVDYLDLLKSDSNYDAYRLELGNITVALKKIAVQYAIPVVTATQLGRSAYRVNDSHELNLDQISESMKKIEHADCIMLLTGDNLDPSTVYAKIGKNRSGKSNIALTFKVDFEKYKFISGSRTNNNASKSSSIPSDDKKLMTCENRPQSITTNRGIQSLKIN